MDLISVNKNIGRIKISKNMYNKKQKTYTHSFFIHLLNIVKQ